MYKDKHMLTLIIGIFSIAFFIFGGYYTGLNEKFSISYTGLALSCVLISTSMLIKHLNQYKETVRVKNNLSEIVKEKTAKLTERNEQLTEQEVELRRSYKQVEEQKDKLAVSNSELAFAKDKIEQQEREKTGFYINLMHHLKTPVSVIRGFLELEEYRGDRNLMIALNNARQLSNELLSYLNVEAAVNRGESSYNHEGVTDISEILKQIAICYGGYNLTERIEPGLKVKIDSNGFSQLATCLLDNSFRHNSSSVEVELSLVRAGEMAQLTVSDNGAGIHKESVPNIFKPFYQLANKGSNRQGIGMGLSLVTRIVNDIEGKIELDNRPGEGVSFSLSFPLTDEAVTFDYEGIDYAVVSLHDDRIDAGDSEYEPCRVNLLVVEDNRGMIAMIKEYLKEYNIFTAFDGREGLKRLEELSKTGRDIELILSDEMMDNMSGFEFLKEVRMLESYKGIPFIFLTAKTDLEHRLEGLERGAVDYLGKPFNPKELQARVKAQLEQKDNIIDSYVESEALKKTVLQRCNELGLSMKQSEYSYYYVMDLSAQQIADKYTTKEKELKAKTVENTINRVYQKLAIKSKKELKALILP